MVYTSGQVQAQDPNAGAQPWLLLPCSLASGKLFNLHVPPYSHLENENASSTFFLIFIMESKW